MRIKILLAFSIITFSDRGNCETYEKPSWLKTCQLKMPEFTKCSTESIRGLFANTFNGNLKIKGLDSVDPMYLDKISVLQGNGPVAVNASLANVKFIGMSTLELIENQVSAKDYSWLTTIKIPKLRLESDYRMRGQILIIPLNGRGKAWFEPTNLKVKVKTTTKLYAKSDHTFYNVTNCRVQFSMEGVKFRMTNLFNGNKALDDGINQYLNDNWKIASDALKPIIAKTIEGIMLEYLQKTFHDFPGDFLVSDLPSPEKLEEKSLKT